MECLIGKGWSWNENSFHSEYLWRSRPDYIVSYNSTVLFVFVFILQIVREYSSRLNLIVTN